MRWLFLTAALVFVIGVAGCADEGKVPGDWQIFWIELDLAVVSFVLCWLVVAFSRYVSNRLVLSRKDLMAMMAAPAVPAAPTSKADRPENQPDLAPVHIEGEEDEDTSKKAGKSKARKTGMEQRKRSIHTSILIGFFVALLFFSLIAAIDYMMTFRVGAGAEAVRIPYSTSGPEKVRFHLWGLSLVFKNHVYFALFANAVALHKISYAMLYIPVFEKLAATEWFNYVISYIFFFLTAYVGARRTKRLWSFPLIILVLNVVLNVTGLFLGWYGEASDLMQVQQEMLRMKDMGLPM